MRGPPVRRSAPDRDLWWDEASMSIFETTGGLVRGRLLGPIAPQSARLPGSPTWSPDDEGILTVNVWTPASADGSLPVLFWIHGGAYTFGSSAHPELDGTTLARAGLVVVTCNYRLGFEGCSTGPSPTVSPALATRSRSPRRPP